MKPKVNLVCVLAAAATLVSALPTATADVPLDMKVQHALDFAASQLRRTALEVPITSSQRYPSTTGTDGTWNTTTSGGWTSGFFPGSMWRMYEITGDTFWRNQAHLRTEGLAPETTNTRTHDVGFIIDTSYGNGYRLLERGDYREAMLTAAGSLAGRYRPEVGCTRSWDHWPDCNVIIDNMMNLELLLRASDLPGGDPKWREIAISHALRTAENHVRSSRTHPDEPEKWGSTYHLVMYSPTTGEVQYKTSVQGYATESTWARGQAWGLYGFAMVARHTGDERMLATARSLADWFLENLPEDHVPYWDFDAPNKPDEPRDTSAAAIAAAGLLDLVMLIEDPEEAAPYFVGAGEILDSLCSNYLTEQFGSEPSSSAILSDGYYSRSTGTVWGDYYFIEALQRYQAIPEPTVLSLLGAGGVLLHRRPRQPSQ